MSILGSELGLEINLFYSILTHHEAPPPPKCIYTCMRNAITALDGCVSCDRVVPFYYMLGFKKNIYMLLHYMLWIKLYFLLESWCFLQKDGADQCQAYFFIRWWFQNEWRFFILCYRPISKRCRLRQFKLQTKAYRCDNGGLEQERHVKHTRRFQLASFKQKGQTYKVI